ncbi:hypothetical protein VTN02DRAFT_4775 [Thermoascus thermophilus]
MGNLSPQTDIVSFTFDDEPTRPATPFVFLSHQPYTLGLESKSTEGPSAREKVEEDWGLLNNRGHCLMPD